MTCGWENRKAGWRCRISPTCTLSPKWPRLQLKDGQDWYRSSLCPEAMCFDEYFLGQQHLRPIAVQQRHLWDSNPRGQSLSSKVSWKHQNQCRSPRFPPSLVVGLRLTMSLHVLANTQHNPPSPIFWALLDLSSSSTKDGCLSSMCWRRRGSHFLGSVPWPGAGGDKQKMTEVPRNAVCWVLTSTT